MLNIVGGILVYKKRRDMIRIQHYFLSLLLMLQIWLLWRAKDQNIYSHKLNYFFVNSIISSNWDNEIQAVGFCTNQLYFKEAVFALLWIFWLLCCSEQASLLLLSINVNLKFCLGDQKTINTDYGETTRGCSCYMLVHGGPVVVSSSASFSLPARPPTGFSIQGNARVLISSYCSICRLRKLKDEKLNKQSSSLHDSGLQVQHFTVKQLKAGQESTTSCDSSTG